MTTLTEPATTLAPPAEVRRDDDAPRPEPPPIIERDALPDSPPLPEWVPRYKFDVNQYIAIVNSGVLEDDRVELIDGEIIAMSGMGPEHVASVNSSTRFWIMKLGERAIAQIQSAIRLDEGDMPEPDVAILKPRDDFYVSRLPGPDDILLIVEVSDTTLRIDRQVKLARYARFGIPEVWIANMRARAIEAYTDPVDGEYATRRIFRRGQTVSPTAFPDVAAPVSDIILTQPESGG